MTRESVSSRVAEIVEIPERRLGQPRMVCPWALDLDECERVFSACVDLALLQTTSGGKVAARRQNYPRRILHDMSSL
jgi:hypothetical protein